MATDGNEEVPQVGQDGHHPQPGAQGPAGSGATMDMPTASADQTPAAPTTDTPTGHRLSTETITRLKEVSRPLYSRDKP